ncbi:MAG: enoyl-CoA hydratase/isomerase family protein [Pseudotabrizicola sp.]|uniref:enoyl-CoA hydratase/isomerase family protein n=1 Tax=Pseudotabrizicola sp. TaxID=2939647 RepID=UPI002715BED0|nr:enoyl-CoA hydratase/isomerase family protein [Pseudotabrizicola sp.]MDO8883596.1 enoyl-CoA hydratase/isomerase family protein [Pseudotabrizicola sp.]MDP2081249.1 enoyl-CoA hydratase/isomerase family protein [Pseudotabrizicola sp.]MDZ7576132.1 enoyl-CoA hydratase/isomerase family protein [Pseudotabrizicola sp.]
MINVELDGRLLTLTLNRQDKANSLTRLMLEELDAALAHAELKGVRAVILTGAGNVFSAGADLDDARAGLATDPVWERLSARVAGLPCLTIAALNGTLAGGAMGMVLACDLRLAVPAAKFFYPVMKLGFLPQPTDPRRMSALIGPARSKMVLMGGARIDAAEALSWGLIDRITSPESLMEDARLLASDAMAASADHVAAIKRLVPMA